MSDTPTVTLEDLTARHTAARNAMLARFDEFERAKTEYDSATEAYVSYLLTQEQESGKQIAGQFDCSDVSVDSESPPSENAQAGESAEAGEHAEQSFSGKAR